MAKINSGFCCAMVATAVLLTACSKAEKQASDFSGRSSDPMLAPIFDTQAPTVKTLINKGFLIVDEREASVKCGWFSFCDGFDALYLGSQGRSDDISGIANFACPGTDDHSDNWKCRELKPPYVPSMATFVESASPNSPAAATATREVR